MFAKVLFTALVAYSLGAAIEPNHEPLSQELVDFVNNAKTTWQAGHNDYFKDVPMDVIKGMMGARRRPTELQVIEGPAVDALPDNFDSREKWSNCKSLFEVRDQAACGSCWAFGAVESITDRICIASKGAQNPHISAEDLNSCCYECGDGCGGGYPDEAWNWWVSEGIVTGSNYSSHSGCQPYTIKNCDHHVKGRFQPCGSEEPTPTCQKECISGYGKTYRNDKHKGKSSYTVNGVESAMREIYTNGPMEASYNVYADFLSYKSGVYQHKTGSLLGGHAVKIIGFGTENGTPYWLIANSWNTDWGDKGFFKIKRGVNECGIEDDIIGGLPEL